MWQKDDTFLSPSTSANNLEFCYPTIICIKWGPYIPSFTKIRQTYRWSTSNSNINTNISTNKFLQIDNLWDGIFGDIAEINALSCHKGSILENYSKGNDTSFGCAKRQTRLTLHINHPLLRRHCYSQKVNQTQYNKNGEY